MTQTTAHRIAARSTIQAIITAIAKQGINPGIAKQPVRAVTTMQNVVTIIAMQGVVTGGDEQIEEFAITEDFILAAAAIDAVATAHALDLIFTGIVRSGKAFAASAQNRFAIESHDCISS